jgi:RNA polymerase subunit RPABC4/transcription elongation factor Spt4
MADVYACRNCDEVTISENKPLSCQYCGGTALTRIDGVHINVISEESRDDNSEELDLLERTYGI